MEGSYFRLGTREKVTESSYLKLDKGARESFFFLD